MGWSDEESEYVKVPGKFVRSPDAVGEAVWQVEYSGQVVCSGLAHNQATALADSENEDCEENGFDPLAVVVLMPGSVNG